MTCQKAFEKWLTSQNKEKPRAEEIEAATEIPVDAHADTISTEDEISPDELDETGTTHHTYTTNSRGTTRNT